MRTLLFAVAALFISQLSFAQIETPAPSPMCELEQMVGLTEVEIEFSRPSVKGRELFVDVEKFGKIWRTGANASTKITFGKDVMVEGNEVPAGTYAIYSIPGKDMWTVMLYKDLELGGNVNNYNTDDELLRFEVKPKMNAGFVESFFIMIDDLTYESATISLMWGKYIVPFNLKVHTDKEVMNSISSTLEGPAAGDYYAAASYYYRTGKDMEQALEWVQKANAESPRFWTMRMEAEIQQKLGNKEEAMKTMMKSSEMAREAGYNGYAEQNDKIVMGWK